MIKVTDINVTIEQAACSDTVLVTDMREAFKYENGKRTDVSDGFRYNVVAPSNKYVDFTIKTQRPFVTPEQLAAAKDGVVKVRVKGFAGRFYRIRSSNGNIDYAFTATAESLEVVTQ